MRQKVAGLIAAAALLGATGGFGALYFAYTRPIGHPPTGELLPAECQISDALKQEARVSNPGLMQQPDPAKRELVQHTHCFWRQTLGQDGNDRRILGIHVYDHADFLDPLTAAGDTYVSQAPPDQHEVAGLGDQAVISHREPDNNMEVTLLVRQGARVYKVNYRGAIRGFFFDRPFPAEEGERITRKVVDELMGRS